MLPRVLFDKSAIEMLNPQEVEELSLCFDFLCTPTLTREIIADLKKDPTRSRRMPENVVRALASKLGAMHLVTPANFRKLATGNLLGNPVPMNGFTVPLDEAPRNVHSSPDGTKLAYESFMEQEL